MSSKTAEHMSWHETHKPSDDRLTHPRDGLAWKAFDATYPGFSNDPRNVRLALSTDGFNPFGNLSTSYSVWPVVLVPYNLPPWMCMKQSSFILSMIIPGKKGPGNDIDVYLQPLIEELQELWNDGVQTYDAFTKELFTLRAALMWTISDFPGLGVLSGWNTHTGKACPVCNFDCDSTRLPFSRKWCFMGHRRFLRAGHRFRSQKNRFNGEMERRGPPALLSGDDIVAQLENVNVQFGKVDNTNRTSQQWRKRSIFFSLPYWRTNLLRHTLDVMHIEKNVCDNVLYTILNDPAKTKDHLQARKDLQHFGFREEAWPDENEKFLPGRFTLTRGDKANFLYTLKRIQVPDGHSSNISRCIDLNARKVSGLKSHDCHVLMQQFLPLALKDTLPTDVSVVLVEFCSFFRRICSKVLTLAELDEIQEKLVLTLCHLEMLFPPSFFTVMVHLTVHLVHETKLAGPVQYRWMYPMERFLGKLKSYVRNKTWPEGSIAEGYIADEVMYFISRYFNDNDDIETHYNRLSRIDDRPNAQEEMFLPKELSLPRIGRAVGAGHYVRLTPYEFLQAHRHVLNNCTEVDPYLQDFRRRLRSVMKIRGHQSSTELDKRVHREFSSWFRGQIAEHPIQQSFEMRCLAMGPLERVRRFSGYNVNGFKFCTVSRDEGLLTQNSGVFGTFGTRSYASTSDQNMQFGAVPYYGKVIDIIELNYQGAFTVTLFKCLWANTTTSRGLQTDELGITSVNFSRQIHTGESEDDEPFILATEAQQVYYVQNPKNPNWSMVVHITPRDLYDMGDGDNDVTFDNVPLQPQNFEQFFPHDDENVPLVRAEDNDDHDD